MLLQTSANLKCRLQKAEAELEIGLSCQQRLQLQLDSASAKAANASVELEAEVQTNADLAAECKAQQLKCKHVRYSIAYVADFLHLHLHTCKLGCAVDLRLDTEGE